VAITALRWAKPEEGLKVGDDLTCGARQAVGEGEGKGKRAAGELMGWKRG
jgi:hypothetical protein